MTEEQEQEPTEVVAISTEEVEALLEELMFEPCYFNEQRVFMFNGKCYKRARSGDLKA